MKILHVEKLTSEKWLNLFAATFEHNGHTGRWVFASRLPQPYPAEHPGDAVLIVPLLITAGQPTRLVLIKEFRVPVGDYVYGLPAGLLEHGESMEEAVRREVVEETGFEVIRFKRFSPPLYSSSGMTDESAPMAFVDVRATPGGRQALEASEDIEVVLLDYPQVCQLCDSKVRIDAKAWTILYLYSQLGKLE